MMMTHALPLTLTDLTIPDNVTQARYELNRAADRGDDPALAAWAKKWGEPALLAAEEGPDREDVLELETAPASTEAADDALAKLEERLDTMNKIVGRSPLDLSALAAAVEDARTHLSAAQEALADE